MKTVIKSKGGDRLPYVNQALRQAAASEPFVSSSPKDARQPHVEGDSRLRLPSIPDHGVAVEYSPSRDTPCRAQGHKMSRVRVLELFASAFGLAGMYLGSTTLNGAICYAVAIPCLIGCVCLRRLWGLLPLNLAQAAVIASFLLHAL